MTHKEATLAASQMQCIVCLDSPCEPCHFPKHRGMGGAGAGWNPWEWVPMCRIHHDYLDGRMGVSKSADSIRKLCTFRAERYLDTLGGYE